jgi:hypothetical protein
MALLSIRFANNFKEVRWTMRSIDTQCDGTHSIEDFRRAVARFGLQITDVEERALLTLFPSTSAPDKRIDYDAFMDALQERHFPKLHAEALEKKELLQSVEAARAASLGEISSAAAEREGASGVPPLEFGKLTKDGSMNGQYVQAKGAVAVENLGGKWEGKGRVDAQEDGHVAADALAEAVKASSMAAVTGRTAGGTRRGRRGESDGGGGNRLRLALPSVRLQKTQKTARVMTSRSLKAYQREYYERKLQRAQGTRVQRRMQMVQELFPDHSRDSLKQTHKLRLNGARGRLLKFPAARRMFLRKLRDNFETMAMDLERGGGNPKTLRTVLRNWGIRMNDECFHEFWTRYHEALSVPVVSFTRFVVDHCGDLGKPERAALLHRAPRARPR